MNILRLYPCEIFCSWVVRMYTLSTKKEESRLNKIFGVNKFGICKIKRFRG